MLFSPYFTCCLYHNLRVTDCLNICAICLQVEPITLEFELAALVDRSGKKSLAKALFEDAYKHVSRLCFELKDEAKRKHMLPFDYRVGAATFSEWFSSPRTFKTIGDWLKLGCSNFVMAAEM